MWCGRLNNVQVSALQNDCGLKLDRTNYSHTLFRRGCVDLPRRIWADTGGLGGNEILPFFVATDCKRPHVHHWRCCIPTRRFRTLCTECVCLAGLRPDHAKTPFPYSHNEKKTQSKESILCGSFIYALKSLLLGTTDLLCSPCFPTTAPVPCQVVLSE